jgi:hypothetical protein
LEWHSLPSRHWLSRHPTRIQACHQEINLERQHDAESSENKLWPVDYNVLIVARYGLSGCGIAS